MTKTWKVASASAMQMLSPISTTTHLRQNSLGFWLDSSPPLQILDSRCFEHCSSRGCKVQRAESPKPHGHDHLLLIASFHGSALLPQADERWKRTKTWLSCFLDCNPMSPHLSPQVQSQCYVIPEPTHWKVAPLCLLLGLLRQLLWLGDPSGLASGHLTSHSHRLQSWGAHNMPWCFVSHRPPASSCFLARACNGSHAARTCRRAQATITGQ